MSSDWFDYKMVVGVTELKRNVGAILRRVQDEHILVLVTYRGQGIARIDPDWTGAGEESRMENFFRDMEQDRSLWGSDPE